MATVWSEIPVQPFPMRFAIVLDGLSYVMQTQYRDAPEAGWLLDIEDGGTGRAVARGIALVTGSDLLEQYKYLVPGQLWIVSDGGDDSAPTFTSLGVKHHLLYGADDNG
jgi:hypothetical protein